MRALALFPFVAIACTQNVPPATATVFNVSWNLRDPSSGAALLCNPGETVTLQAGFDTTITTATWPCEYRNWDYPRYLSAVEIAVGLDQRMLHVELSTGPISVDVPITPVAGELNRLYVEIPVAGAGSVGAIAPSWLLRCNAPGAAYCGGRGDETMTVAWGSASTSVGAAAWRSSWDLGLPDTTSYPLVPYAAIVDGLPVGPAHVTLQLGNSGSITSQTQVDAIVVGGRTTMPDLAMLPDP